MNLEINWPPKFVRICKIAEAPDAVAQAMPPADYPYGLPESRGSLPVLYAMDGWLLRLPRAGEPVRLLRFARNEVIMPGVYFSSEVVSVPREGEFITLNSIYHWWEIGDAPPLTEPISGARAHERRREHE